MSLDVYLKVPGETRQVGPRIFIREDGQTKEISREEWFKRNPDREPVAMAPTTVDYVFHANMTHNMIPMANDAGIYDALWRPEHIGIKQAQDLVGPLQEGLVKLESNREHYESLNPPSGWGTYAAFVPWLRRYIAACLEWPDAYVSVSR